VGALDGKVALVTGAARAQGRAHAVALARAGADLIIGDIAAEVDGLDYPLGTEDELEETADLVRHEGRRVVARPADVRSQADLDSLVEQGVAELGGVDILIANAGIFHTTPVWEISEEMWQTVVDTNLSGIWRSVKAVMPAMIERGGGAMVLVSSANGLEPGTSWAHYTAAKTGVLGLMQAVALEGAPFDVRCNAICPGLVRTGMTVHQAALDRYAGRPGAGTMADFDAAGLRFHPTRSLGALEPEQVASAALWLVSPESAPITGAAVPVDAGHVLVPGYRNR